MINCQRLMGTVDLFGENVFKSGQKHSFSPRQALVYVSLFDMSRSFASEADSHGRIGSRCSELNAYERAASLCCEYKSVRFIKIRNVKLSLIYWVRSRLG